MLSNITVLPIAISKLVISEEIWYLFESVLNNLLSPAVPFVGSLGLIHIIIVPRVSFNTKFVELI